MPALPTWVQHYTGRIYCFGEASAGLVCKGDETKFLSPFAISRSHWRPGASIINLICVLKVLRANYTGLDRLFIRSTMLPNY